MILDSTLKTIEVVLEGAITTNQLDVTAAYADTWPSGPFVPGEQDESTNGATPVTAVAAPPASVQRMVNEIRVYNKDTVLHTVTIQLNNNGTRRVLQKQPVSAGAVMVYAPSGGTLADLAPLDFVELESGTVPVKISAMPQVDVLTAPFGTIVGTELSPFVSAGANQTLTLASLYILMASWLDWVTANPLDGTSPNEILLAAGSGSSGSNASGAHCNLVGGAGDGSGSGGNARFTGGTAGATGSGGSVQLTAADSNNNNMGGQILSTAGNGDGSGAGGAVIFTAGTGGATGDGGAVTLNAGAGTSTGVGGAVEIFAGAGGGGAGGNGGTITLTIGTGTANGNLIIVNLPTSSAGLPSNAIWCDTGAGSVLKRV